MGNRNFIKSEFCFNLSITYGVASERRKATFKQNTNDVQWTRYYASEYDKTIFADDHSRELHYISGPSGLVAINVRNSAATEDSLYFVFKDHLGSLTTITDKNGSVLQQLNYNLWGKRSIAGGNYTSCLFDRGFTGHEHLDMFGLINMNGRVYDPLLGRFLSPDKYVQGGGSQAFNRYTYCRNNPLNNIDPSGYMFGWYAGTSQLNQWFYNYWARQMGGSYDANQDDGRIFEPSSSHRRTMFDRFTEQNMSEMFGTPEYITVHGSDFTDYWNSYRNETEEESSSGSVEVGPLSAPDYNPDETNNDPSDNKQQGYTTTSVFENAILLNGVESYPSIVQRTWKNIYLSPENEAPIINPITKSKANYIFEENGLRFFYTGDPFNFRQSEFNANSEMKNYLIIESKIMGPNGTLISNYWGLSWDQLRINW